MPPQRRTFSVNTDAMRALKRDFNKFGTQAVPHATREALNAMAFEARRVWVELLPKRMTIRSTFTRRSLQVDKARGTNMTTMAARVGSTAPYMDEQEDGGDKGKKGKHGVPIPTSSAAGQGMSARPRTRLVQVKNWMSAIHLAPRVSGIRQRRNAAALAIAQKNGTGVAFLDLGKGRSGIFRVTGRKRGLSVRMIWDLSRKRVTIPKNPTLEPSVAAARMKGADLYVAALNRQVRRNRIFGH